MSRMMRAAGLICRRAAEEWRAAGCRRLWLLPPPSRVEGTVGRRCRIRRESRDRGISACLENELCRRGGARCARTSAQWSQ